MGTKWSVVGTPLVQLPVLELLSCWFCDVSSRSETHVFGIRDLQDSIRSTVQHVGKHPVLLVADVGAGARAVGSSQCTA